MSEPETLDLVVVGAGWAGLSAARTYHALHPEASIAIIDTAATVGGVWSEQRLYPGLRSNNMLGTYEFPDFPMDPATYDIQPGQHIPGPVIHRYLEDFAAKAGILPFFRGRTCVLEAELREPKGWTLSVAPEEENAKTTTAISTIIARKLIVAAGLTSEPFLPHFAGQETFGKPLFHVRDFRANANTLETAKTVAVFGGTKSAWDMVYSFASKGTPVEWVIRSTGHGPIWQAPPYVTPLKKWLEKLVMTRMLTWFSPCIWGTADGYTGIRGFYHGTALGRRIVDTFWSILGGDVLTANQYDAHPETAKLKPWASNAMFVGSSFSILNYPTDFFELVRSGTVRIHIAEIANLSPGKVHLTDGTQLAADALCCATGWRHVPPLTFLPAGIDRELGLPHTEVQPEPLLTPAAVEAADAQILADYPRLRDQPVINPRLTPMLTSGGLSADAADKSKITPDTPLTPYTLYHFMVPPSERFLRRRDIAFAGIAMNFSIPIMAHAQSLWISAYFDRTLPATTVPLLPANPGQPLSPEDAAALQRLRQQTVLYSRFGKWRYPAAHGAQFPDFVFDALPYIDLLVGDLGLPIYRKGGWLAEATSPYGPEDYKDLVAEWKLKLSEASA